MKEERRRKKKKKEEEEGKEVAPKSEKGAQKGNRAQIDIDDTWMMLPINQCRRHGEGIIGERE